MHIRSRALSWLLFLLIASVLLAATLVAGHAQTPARPAAPARQATPARPPAEPGSYTPNTPVPTDRDVAATQSQLIKLLRLSPTLTTVVSRDPSLLSNPEYVAHNNPQLAEFLANHPEVARNPEFYLFTHMHPDGGGPDEALQREVWPDVYRAPQQRSAFSEFASDLPPLLAFACFLVALTWMTRVFVENRRWGRIFKLQSEVHGRLIDKFTSNQELALYMETEAGKRFLEAAPIPVGFETNQRVPNAVARVLTPLQIGIVLVLLGVGMLGIRRADHEMEIPMLIMGTLVLMPGVGFIISAGITWLLAARLGLMPDRHAASNPYEPPFISPNRQ
jgi:hypothetical protein